MALKLYILEGSPASRSVLMLADILNIPLETIEVNYFEKHHLTPEFRKVCEDFLRNEPGNKQTFYLMINPLHTIPALVDGDLILHDSHVIITYLTEKCCRDHPLYPTDLKQRALIDQKLYFDTLIFRRMRNITAPAIEDGVRRPTKKQMEELQETYYFTEEFLSRTKYIAGDNITLADLSVVATVSTIDKLIPLDAKKYPKTQAWFKTLEKQPFYQKCNVKGLNAVAGVLESYLDL